MSDTKKTWTTAEVADPATFQLHREEIMRAAAEGRVVKSKTAPAKPVFKSSQLRDHNFYLENKADIDLALRQGRVLDDRAKPKRTPWNIGIDARVKPEEPDISPSPAPLEDMASGPGSVPPTGLVRLDRVFKQSQLLDHQFYLDNKAEVELAYREGRILKDL